MKTTYLKQQLIILLGILLVSSPLFAQKAQQSEIRTILSGEMYPRLFESEIKSSPILKNATPDMAGLMNINVSRNPEQVLISPDDKYAFVRCYLGNAIEFIDIKSAKVINSFKIPSPTDISISIDGTKLIVASYDDTFQVPTSDIDQCGTTIIDAILKPSIYIIDIANEVIEKKYPIPEGSTVIKIMTSLVNDIVYLNAGRYICEFDQKDGSITRKWDFKGESQPRKAILYPNQNRIIMVSDSIKAIDLKSGLMQSAPYLKEGNLVIHSDFLGLDTTSNRIFTQGDFGESSYFLVFDASTFAPIKAINCEFSLGTILALPKENVLYASGFGQKALEIDYTNLTINKVIDYDMIFTMVYNPNNNKIYALSKGISQGWMSSTPPYYLDITEYNLNNAEITTYNTTNSTYTCCWGRSLSLTSNGNMVLATNSPENTISILNLSSITSVANGIDYTESLIVAPNPTKGLIKLSVNSTLESDYQIELRDLNGRLLKSEHKTRDECDFNIDLSNYKSGLYILSLISPKTYLQTKVVRQ